MPERGMDIDIQHTHVIMMMIMFYRLPEDLTPTFATPDPGNFHPSQPTTTFFANISPKPNITPLTKGKRQLIARLDASAPSRVCIGKLASKIATVAEGGGGALGC